MSKLGQPGSGIRTPSPTRRSTSKASRTAVVPPVVTTTLSVDAGIEFCARSFDTMASRSDVVPRESVYLTCPSCIACIAAWITWGGVGKSGSPISRWRWRRPSATSARSIISRIPDRRIARTVSESSAASSSRAFRALLMPASRRGCPPRRP